MSHHVTEKKFPQWIKSMPRADYSDDGGEAIRGYVVQNDRYQIVFNENDKEMQFTPHVHASSFGIVISGWCELVIDGESRIYHAGETYNVPGGVRHFARQSENYKDIVIFDEGNRVPVMS